MDIQLEPVGDRRQQVIHTTVNGRYRMVIERAASTKGVLGFKLEVNSDSIPDAVTDMAQLKIEVERLAGATFREV